MSLVAPRRKCEQKEISTPALRWLNVPLQLRIQIVDDHFTLRAQLMVLIVGRTVSRRKDYNAGN